MSYAQSNLLRDERIVYAARVHWWTFVPGGVLVVFALPLSWAEVEPLGSLLLLVGFIALVRAALYKASTELVLTNRRVIGKLGFIRRETIELNLTKVESFNVQQSISGRVFGFGTVTVCGTGGTRTGVRSIADPLEFRRKAMGAVDGEPGLASATPLEPSVRQP